MALQLGEEAPNFTAETTEGTIDFHEWIGDSWAVLFSHPKDFTPVCTTELGYMAKIKPEFDKRDIHVHVPEGATPKDGPSAGIAMATSIVSVFTGIPVRREIAMTGEVTLRGRVLPIGGLKAKLLAALRAGVTTVFIPKENEKDLADIPDNVKKDLTILPVSHVDEVIAKALVRAPEAIEWEEPEEAVQPAVPATAPALTH